MHCKSQLCGGGGRHAQFKLTPRHRHAPAGACLSWPIAAQQRYRSTRAPLEAKCTAKRHQRQPMAHGEKVNVLVCTCWVCTMSPLLPFLTPPPSSLLHRHTHTHTHTHANTTHASFLLFVLCSCRDLPTVLRFLIMCASSRTTRQKTN